MSFILPHFPAAPRGQKMIFLAGPAFAGRSKRTTIKALQSTQNCLGAAMMMDWLQSTRPFFALP
eukprot:scaffold13342_cov13-Tisochrysis_lutea.AAC.1